MNYEEWENEFEDDFEEDFEEAMNFSDSEWLTYLELSDDFTSDFISSFCKIKNVFDNTKINVLYDKMCWDPEDLYHSYCSLIDDSDEIYPTDYKASCPYVVTQGIFTILKNCNKPLSQRKYFHYNEALSKFYNNTLLNLCTYNEEDYNLLIIYIKLALVELNNILLQIRKLPLRIQSQNTKYIHFYRIYLLTIKQQLEKF